VLPSRLYAILDIDLTTSRGLDADALLDAWLSAGVRLIQLRAKSASSGMFLAMAERMSQRARDAGATFLINDRADIAYLGGASGVHVGQDDLRPRDARRVMGATAGFLVGLSTHSDDELRSALAEPIDYLAVGAVYPTASRPAGHPIVGLDGVRRAVEVARARALPVVAIGGITLASAPEVLHAGASAVAVISDLLDGNPRARAQAYLKVLEG
jgi:thiamine-phosphate pyrophosphorylase